MDRLEISEISKIAGIFLAVNIGAGFASGQEIFQFFTSFGLISILGILLCFIILAYACRMIIMAGYRTKNNPQISAFEFFGGKKIGLLYHIIMPLTYYGGFIVMISGAANTIEQYFHIPSHYSRIFIVLLMIATLFLNFQKISHILSKIGKIIGIVIVIISIIILSRYSQDILHNNELIATLPAKKAANTWYIAAILYSSLITLASIQYLFELGHHIHRPKSAIMGIMCGISILCIAILLVSLALTSKYPEIYQLDIITLYLAEKSNSILGMLVALSLPIAMCAASTINLWSIGNIIKKKCYQWPRLYYIITITLSILGYFFASLPFNELVHIIYPINGILGFGFLLIILSKTKEVLNYREQ